MLSKDEIKSSFLQQELTHEVLLNYIVDLKYEIELLKNKKTIQSKKVETNTEVCPQNPKMNFYEFNKNYLYPKIKHYLEIVFENDLFTGIKYLFENNMFENMPIYNSNGRITSFHIFENDTWTKLSTERLNKYIEQIIEEFMFVFNAEWIQVNQEKLLVDESYQEKYLKYMEKFVGNNSNHQEKIISQLKPFLAKLLKS
ncbi:hypothetical protein CL656_03605 [bacterium]|nr:hypothetical protein [bacterium]|tara:strand:+ start:226 stop:822 length:597 start_codon:yes stop_codon:yes gene_type:complete